MTQQLDDKVFDLVVRGTRAKALGRWDLVAACAADLASRVNPTLELLARFVVDLVDEDDPAQAAVVWFRLVNALLPPHTLQLAATQARTSAGATSLPHPVAFDHTALRTRTRISA